MGSGLSNPTKGALLNRFGQAVSAAMVSSVTLLGLVSCNLVGPSEEQLLLQADCEQVFSNAGATYKWADDVKMNYWPRTYAALNAGVESREKARRDIDRQFPWIAEAVAAVVTEIGWETLEYSEFLVEDYAEALTLNELVNGSSLSPAFSEQELARIRIAGEDAPRLVANVRGSIFDRWSDSALSECPGLTSSSLVDGFEKRFERSLQNAKHSARQMVVLFSCETRGDFEGTECAIDDFQANPSYAPTERRDPFQQPFRDPTTQGLAEFAWCWDLGLEVRPDRAGCW